MSVFEDIKNGLLQAITFEKERKAIRSHFERSKKDIKDGRVLLAEEAIESVADELISFSCLNENGRGRSQTTTGTKKNNKKSEKALSQADFPKNPVISFSVLRANIANRKRYRFGKPRNHSGFGVLLCHFLRRNSKDIISPNDLWGGLERNIWAFRGRFCDLFRRAMLRLQALSTD